MLGAAVHQYLLEHDPAFMVGDPLPPQGFSLASLNQPSSTHHLADGLRYYSQQLQLIYSKVRMMTAIIIAYHQVDFNLC